AWRRPGLERPEPAPPAPGKPIETMPSYAPGSEFLASSRQSCSAKRRRQAARTPSSVDRESAVVSFEPSQPAARKAPGEVLGAFLKLGVTSFGGPIAHLGYFRDELVIRRRWLDEAGYAELVALCQFLPGPTSSQAGFALGLLRGGWLGACLAWAAFTLPSALLLFALALCADAFDGPLWRAGTHGLKLVAVAVVAHAVRGMARSLTPDRQRVAIAIVAGAGASFPQHG